MHTMASCVIVTLSERVRDQQQQHQQRCNINTSTSSYLLLTVQW